MRQDNDPEQTRKLHQNVSNTKNHSFLDPVMVQTLTCLNCCSRSQDSRYPKTRKTPKTPKTWSPAAAEKNGAELKWRRQVCCINGGTQNGPNGFFWLNYYFYLKINNVTAKKSYIVCVRLYFANMKSHYHRRHTETGVVGASTCSLVPVWYKNVPLNPSLAVLFGCDKTNIISFNFLSSPTLDVTLFKVSGDQRWLACMYVACTCIKGVSHAAKIYKCCPSDVHQWSKSSSQTDKWLQLSLFFKVWSNVK